MKHYMREELELYRNGRTNILSKLQCYTHLKTCAECRQLLEELKEEDCFIEKLKNSVKIFSELSGCKPDQGHEAAKQK